MPVLSKLNDSGTGKIYFMPLHSRNRGAEKQRTSILLMLEFNSEVAHQAIQRKALTFTV